MSSQRSTGYNYLGSLLATISVLTFSVYFMFIVLGIGDVGLGKLFQSPVFLVFILAMIVVLPVVAVIYFKRTNRQDLNEYISLSVILYVIAFLMFFYGYSKMYGKFFEITYLTQDSKVMDVSSFSLAWYFFGRSNVQEFLLGLLEFIPAILLLFRKTRFLGLVAIFPVAANVLLVNIFNRVSGLTFPVSFLIFTADVYLLYGYKDRIVVFLKSINTESDIPLDGMLKVGRLLFKILIIGTIAFTFGAPIVTKIFKSKPNYVQRNKFNGGFELEEIMVNGAPVHIDTGNNKYYRSIYLEPQSRWNTVLTFATKYHPVALLIKWNADNDSVQTHLKLENDVTTEAVDSSTKFTGTYRLVDQKLIVSGIQYGDTIKAVYSKKKLKDYNWFW